MKFRLWTPPNGSKIYGSVGGGWLKGIVAVNEGGSDTYFEGKHGIWLGCVLENGPETDIISNGYFGVSFLFMIQDCRVVGHVIVCFEPLQHVFIRSRQVVKLARSVFKPMTGVQASTRQSKSRQVSILRRIKEESWKTKILCLPLCKVARKSERFSSAVLLETELVHGPFKSLSHPHWFLDMWFLFDWFKKSCQILNFFCW